MNKFIYLSGEYKENDCYLIAPEEVLQDVISVVEIKHFEPSLICDVSDITLLNKKILYEFDFGIEFIGYDKDDITEEQYNSLVNLSKHFEIQFNYRRL